MMSGMARLVLCLRFCTRGNFNFMAIEGLSTVIQDNNPRCGAEQFYAVNTSAARRRQFGEDWRVDWRGNSGHSTLI